MYIYSYIYFKNNILFNIGLKKNKYISNNKKIEKDKNNIKKSIN